MRLLSICLATAAAATPATARNLIENGDFELGNTGFSSQYLFSQNLAPPETYAVLDDPRKGHGLFASIGDHTTGDGQMLVVNGSTRNDAPFAWGQEVEVLPATEYTFSLWAANLYGLPGVFAIRINDETVGAEVTAPEVIGEWAPSVRTWNSGSANLARIEIIFLSTAYGGNDTALDDIEFTSEASVCLDPTRLASDPLGTSSFFQQLGTEVIVPGFSNPFLAGLPDGGTAKSDTAPEQSPVLATAVTPGDVLSFGVSGSVSFTGATPVDPPDGGGFASSASAGGIAGYQTTPLPANSLVGVFLGDAVPTEPAPSELSYPSPPLAFPVLAPGLRQVFFIGDGLNGNDTGSRQEFIVPPGATRLFLGVVDGFGWFNNSGAFEVAICRLVAAPTGPRVGPTTVRFSQPLYSADLGEPVNGSIIIDPIPMGGLYSQGTMITLRNLDGSLAGVVTPSIAAVLNFNGPLLNEPAAVSAASGVGGLKGSALFATDRQTLVNPTLGTFALSSLPPGQYHLELEPWNELGPTEDIFVTGFSETLDPYITFGSAEVEIIGSLVPEIALAGALQLNRQTGLLEQRLTVTNNTGRTLNGFRIFLTGLPTDVVARNAHGFIDGVPYIDVLHSLAPGESLEIVLEYYRPSRVADFSPAFELTQPNGVPPTAGGSEPLALDLRVVRKDARGLLVEFLTENGRRYVVEYSDDMSFWRVSQPPIMGTGERVQWLDQGPPKTATTPGGTRFYRLTADLPPTP